MRSPSPLLRKNKSGHKYDFGHVLVIAGSSSMLGAAALVGLAAMRSGAGLVTIGCPKSLNTALQHKVSSVIMTLPLAETREGTLAPRAFSTILKKAKNCHALALGPGMSRDPQTEQLILKLIKTCPIPMVIDGDGLNALSRDLSVLQKSLVPKILTPHHGEMARLTGLRKEMIAKKRKTTASEFAQDHNCFVILKGPRSIVASPQGETSVNPTGNVGLATAGSGDVLAGMIAAFLAQGLKPYDAARFGAYAHGLAGDLAAKKLTPASLIATDIIDMIPQALKRRQ